MNRFHCSKLLRLGPFSCFIQALYPSLPGKKSFFSDVSLFCTSFCNAAAFHPLSIFFVLPFVFCFSTTWLTPCGGRVASSRQVERHVGIGFYFSAIHLLYHIVPARNEISTQQNYWHDIKNYRSYLRPAKIHRLPP